MHSDSPAIEDLRSAAAWARSALDEIDPLLNIHHLEVAELRAAGVSEAQIAALYPYACETYWPKIRQVPEDPDAAAELDALLLAGDRGNLIYNASFHLQAPFGRILRLAESYGYTEVLLNRFLPDGREKPRFHGRFNPKLSKQLELLPLLLTQVSGRGPIAMPNRDEMLTMHPRASVADEELFCKLLGEMSERVATAIPILRSVLTAS